ncbi:hypothetical protein Dred_2142 [Desulforamulus reducens MI-1]|uniref:Uncharacterized protein n=1 Tax=Desulforamulus reducens (strain ATCC BAA-1160 / DSM 100696 / MI-1) TaxID=349161 RepID=A4J6F6_DESRM|nr:hypothetical protein [Desulforamulus reducens]ABO50659.1 hypothetical protein Dred_2142 [Desulforamulus reducens MI-1]
MFNDPRFALFSLTLLSQNHPDILERMQNFSLWLKQTGESLASIQNAMSEYEASMLSLAASQSTPKELTNQQQPFTTMIMKDGRNAKQVTEQVLSRLSESSLDKLESFLEELNQLILKYGDK